MKKNLNAEIVAVGTELLLGQIANTNAQWISETLASIGIDVHHHVVVGDNLRRVEEQFRISGNRADIIIVTGGLGPTDDDLTREAFQQITGMEIIEHEPAMKKIEAFFQKQNTVMTPNNRKQARVFAGSDVIENQTGMASGMSLSYADKMWFFLPGVPREMKQMMADSVVPHLQHISGQETVIKSTMLRFAGIGESTLEHELQDIIRHQMNPTIAPLAQNKGVGIRLTAKAATNEEAAELIGRKKKEIIDRVGRHYYGADDQTLEEKVLALLKQANKSIGAAESLTGGMFTDKLIAVPGASDVCPGGIVCYDTKVKENVLQIPQNIIHQYGTISKECAAAMAENTSSLLDTDIGISFTGVAGPDSVEGYEAGTVYIALHHKSGNLARKFSFSGDRQAIRKRAVRKGFELLFDLLN
ncbi:putative competence-damage inducible protein [Lentibacillus kapialis]|uniref:Putative competence-damage inducible protein n=1 Tax=Lentibacillus kapialis TaxID=340214 RepID=A0A917UZF8_9BACI|nr:competence/damage-inducible protein A [Lentibacillus kapialis]GGK00539.1 putative competence-damage inducible protein [Lentibacillus kapialis]